MLDVQFVVRRIGLGLSCRDEGGGIHRPDLDRDAHRRQLRLDHQRRAHMRLVIREVESQVQLLDARRLQ